MKKRLGVIIEFLGIGIAIVDLINLIMLRSQNWHLHNFSFFITHFVDILVFLFWLLVGSIITVLGSILSEN